MGIDQVKDEEAIALQAILSKITSTVDGGWNITFAASQSEVSQIMLLSQFRDMPLHVVVMPNDAKL